MHSASADQQSITIAVSGAGGRVAYSLLFRIANGGLFGSSQRVSLRLLEQTWQLPSARATACELEDSAFSLLENVVVTDDAHEAFSGADWIVLLAGSPREQPSPSRTELLKRNGGIYVEHGRAINRASPAARVLVVAAPCNANCMIAMSHAPDVPREHWFALTGIDRIRGKGLIAKKAGVEVGRVSRVIAWGNHGNLIYVDLHNALIDETPAHEVIADVAWSRGPLQEAVRRRSAELFTLRRASPAGTASQAILGSIHAISRPTPINRYFDAAVCSDGSYGVPRGLVFGFPLRSEDGKRWAIVDNLYLDDFAQEQIALNVSQLEQEAVLAERWFS